MNSRQRFHATMNYDNPDRVPYFEEGIRDDLRYTKTCAVKRNQASNFTN